MSKKSAGILLYRVRAMKLEVFLIHMGGPFWAKKDEGAWSIPKGEFTDEEEPLEAAKREFKEETGFTVEGNFIPFLPARQSGGKMIYAWALEGNCDASASKSNYFEMEWPPHSGKIQQFPEADRAEWMDLETAKKKILKSQVTLLENLVVVAGLKE